MAIAVMNPNSDCSNESHKIRMTTKWTRNYIAVYTIKYGGHTYTKLHIYKDICTTTSNISKHVCKHINTFTYVTAEKTTWPQF